MNFRITSACLILFLCIQRDAHAGGLKKVWEIKLSEVADVMKGEAGVPAFVDAVRFSPDGLTIAVVARRGSIPRPVGDGRVFLLQLAAKDGRLKGEPIGIGGLCGEVFEAVGPTISWSPSEKMISTGTELVRLADGKSCRLQSLCNSVFYEADHVAGRADVSPLSSNLVLLDAKCERLGEWTAKGDWQVLDASPDGRSLLAVIEGSRGLKSTIVLLDPEQWKTRGQFVLRENGRSTAQFADNGTAICALDGEFTIHGTARCWDLASGREIAASKSGNVQWPLRTSHGAKRAILSEYGRRFYFEGLTWETGSLQNRTVWDFGTDRGIASWSPKSQSYTVLLNSSNGPKPFTTKDHYAFDISPDGARIVEGGAGTLALYSIRP